jgi:hypothetical protein
MDNQSTEEFVLPPPGIMRRSVAGEHVEKQYVDYIEKNGIESFIQNDMGYENERGVKSVNNPYYIEAQEKYLKSKRFS